MLEKEFAYYLEHQSELLKDYKNSYIVIVGQKIVGSYSNNEDALYYSRQKYPLGTFLIQHCTEGDSAYTFTFHSHVSGNYAPL